LIFCTGQPQQGGRQFNYPPAHPLTNQLTHTEQAIVTLNLWRGIVYILSYHKAYYILCYHHHIVPRSLILLLLVGIITGSLIDEW